MESLKVEDTRSALTILSHIVIYQFFWFGLWFAVIRASKANKLVCDDTKNRAVSIVHGLGSFFMSAIDLMILRPEISAPNSIFETNALIFSVSYFIYDTISCYIINMCDKDLIIHHSITCSGLGWSLFTGAGGPYAYYGVFITEISNFPMHIRKILMNIKRRNTQAFEVSETLYFVLYIISRGLAGPYLLYISVLNFRIVPIPLIVVCALLLVQSLLFIKTMIKIVEKKIKNQNERKAKGVELFWLSVNPQISKLEYIKNKQTQDKIF